MAKRGPMNKANSSDDGTAILTTPIHPMNIILEINVNRAVVHDGPNLFDMWTAR